MKIRKQGPGKFIVLVKGRKERETEKKEEKGELKEKCFLRGKIKVHEDKLYLFRFRQMLRGREENVTKKAISVRK
jgi:hypothetical protein